MKLKTLGKDTSQVDITVVTEHGFWLFAAGKEYYLDFETYPWFKSASIAEIMNVNLLHGTALVWPDLDVDLELASLEHPENYPLVSQV